MITLDWLGCATFRLTIDDLVVFLDAYIDRVPLAPDVGMRAAEVDRADFVLVGHSHFDHIAGAEVIAANTGARVIGSNESMRLLAGAGVPEAQLLPAQGGERFGLGGGVTVRVFPSLHSCIWVGGPGDPGEPAFGHAGLTQNERAAVAAEVGGGPNPSGPAGADPAALEAMLEHRRTTLHSDQDGGALAYLFETPQGSIFYHDTSGCWTGVVRDLRPDVAILAMGGRGNIDGEPIQGSLAQYVGTIAGLLRPRTIVLGHHDDWMPPVTSDMTTPEAIAPVREQLARSAPEATLLEPGYLEGTRLLD
jgi:L-ascorbate metabolism protein UlaG (beta-lactamase superfamily)